MENTRNPFRRTRPLIVLLGLAIAGLQACSSSDSGDGAAGDHIPFSDPVDAATLQAALNTDSSSDEFWECEVGGGSTVLQYRLLADGTGFAVDSSNPTVQSEFTWAVVSATSFNTTIEATGIQNNISDIQFTGRDDMRLTLDESVTLTCGRKDVQAVTPDVSTPSGNDELSYGGVVYGLTHGFEESFSYRPVQENDTHSASDFSVANAPFTSTTIAVGFNPAQTIWRPTGGTVWFEARLFAPGGSFQSATFDYEPDSTDEKGPAVSGRYFFQKAELGIDINQNGSIDGEDGEFIDVAGGSITVNRVAGSDNATMIFDVTLADGVTLAGNFTGQFVLF